MDTDKSQLELNCLPDGFYNVLTNYFLIEVGYNCINAVSVGTAKMVISFLE